MPNHTYKSAAVPFVNQKGERSMKRVKVERYVAGKKPSYANDDDEEYYTTDDEEEHSCHDEEEDRSPIGSEEEDDDSPKRKVELEPVASDDMKQEEESSNDSDDEDDDPRFRRLKQVEAMAGTSSRLSQLQNRKRAEKVEVSERAVVEDEEDEEEIRQRHALAKQRVLEKPILESVKLEQEQELVPSTSNDQPSKPVEEIDLFKDLKIGLRVNQNKLNDLKKTDEVIGNLIEQAKEEAIFTEQLHKKIAEDNRRELEMEAKGKNGVGTNDLESVNTDDEDDELAFAEWKLREIKRVQRDQLERVRLGVNKV